MRSGVRVVAGVGALALIAFGLFHPFGLVQEEYREVVWLASLWGGTGLFGVVVWLSQPPMPRGFHRSVFHVGLVVALGFGMLSLQLLRQQIVQADEIYSRVVVDPSSGHISSNVRPVLRSQRILRGNIVDRNGVLLVSSEVVQDGFARRIYPIAGSFDPTAFGNVVGFLSRRFGQSGLELTYSAYLSGERGSTLARIQDEMLGRPQVGNNLVLTLDANLQAQAYALLGERNGSVVVLDAKSGAVLAMVSVPGFDPRGLSFDYAVEDWAAEDARTEAYWRHLNSDAAGQPLINRPTQGLYPPGSTFKTVTAVAALEHAAVARPDDIHCMDEFYPDPHTPPVVNAVRYGLSSFTGDPSNLERVYAYSCNVAFAQYAIRLGAERLAKQALLFDIYPPHEAPESGIYPGFPDLLTAPSYLYVEPGFLDRPSALADTGYGQGQLLVTPLQMALVAASIANDGVMMRPYLVQRVVRPEGDHPVFEQLPLAIRRVMSKDTARKMRENMRAVGNYGFGSVVNQYAPPGVVIGGKSGTGEHVPGMPPHSWFLAIAPVDDPRYAVAVMVESGGEGSSVAAPLAGQVMRAAFENE
ncbi:MAG: penicillin-binding protein 2 [Chloroflexaceae bacterium]|nr:penicillin-binding protein 2 [Chloroflexaceae bacterium]